MMIREPHQPVRIALGDISSASTRGWCTTDSTSGTTHLPRPDIPDTKLWSECNISKVQEHTHPLNIGNTNDRVELYGEGGDGGGGIQ